MEEEVKPKHLLFHFRPLTEMGSRNVELALTSICPGGKIQIIKGEVHTNGNAR